MNANASNASSPKGMNTTEMGYEDPVVHENLGFEAESNRRQLCWKQIGVWGSSTCEKLAQVSHCHDCAVYTAAGAQLLHRAMPMAYRSQQTADIASVAKPYDSSQMFSVLIFRLAQEWLALPAGLCQQILAPLSFHTLPHRSNDTLLGIVNVRGQLLLKVSLLNILGLNQASLKLEKSHLPEGRLLESTQLESTQLESTQIYPRMVVVAKAAETGEVDTWVFDVDELHGIHSLAFGQLEAAAAGVSCAVESCTRYVFSWHGQPVNFLNDVRLFEALRQQAL
jgi:chemotaxis-related protein WspD